MSSERLVYLNGKFVRECQAVVSIFDRGFLYGDGVFETMRAYGGRIFRLGQHIRRLRRSAEAIHMLVTLSDDQLARICLELLEQNHAEEGIIRISVTRGTSLGGIGTARAAEPTIAAFIRPAMPLPPRAGSDGVELIISSVRKTPSHALSPRIKSMNFLNNIMARSEAEAAGAFDAILLDDGGCITETSTSNIFFARNESLFTPGPESDILLGVTRGAVLELAAQRGMHCRECAIKAPFIKEFNECFVTNSAVELVPVTTINGTPVGTGKPGKIYRSLHAAYGELVQRE